MTPTQTSGTFCLFSLKQQAIVADTDGEVACVDADRRPVDIRTLGGNWPKLYEGLVQKVQQARKLKEEWESRQVKNNKRDCRLQIVIVV